MKKETVEEEKRTVKSVGTLVLKFVLVMGNTIYYGNLTVLCFEINISGGYKFMY